MGIYGNNFHPRHTVAVCAVISKVISAVSAMSGKKKEIISAKIAQDRRMCIQKG